MLPYISSEAETQAVLGCQGKSMYGMIGSLALVNAFSKVAVNLP